MTRGDLSHHRQSVHAAASHNGRVKMGDWNFLGGILEEVHIHSTMMGKIWLTILFIFRMLVLGVAAEDVWNDEQTDFICNTEQPGCRNVCYDLAFPISLIRYWVLQVIFVSSPSLVYMGHALYRLRALEKARQKKKALLRKELEFVGDDLAEEKKRIEREMKQLDQGKLNKAPLRGSLLRTYVAHVITRSIVEVLFMTGQYLLYGFHLYPLFKCEREPCPNSVDCYVSRPTEKSVFMVFMQCIAGISLFLNILEIIHLSYKRLKKGILDFYPHLREERDELEDYMASKSKKESVAQICVNRKATAVSAPGDFTIWSDKTTNVFPNLIRPSELPFQGAAQGNLEGAQVVAESPTAYVCESTTIEPCSLCRDYMIDAQQDLEDLTRVSPSSKENGSPDRCPLRSSIGTSFPTLPVSSAKKPWRAQGSYHCSTVPEGKSSDTDSYGGVDTGCGVVLTQTKSDGKHYTQPPTPESQENYSSESEHQLRPPSSSMASIASSRRASDLQI
ncbi:gap junction protein alpha 9a isoform X1 [Synchiropus splendidus]|uniref:gap junction protein alpha 9a isoform X1 n=2 Tax=Synchiropus splendidus TaxID=270530 RepID=UPI00237E3A24|nr:gap junction protein alpha 9a isoform X1 [Synchiropus splendidus]